MTVKKGNKIITIRNSSCGKVVFSQVSDCPWGREVYTLPGQIPPCADTLPGRHPLAQTLSQGDTPWEDTPLPGRQKPLPGQTPWEADTPLSSHSPWQADTPQANTPQQMATAVDGTHPTGMHSCYY